MEQIIIYEKDFQKARKKIRENPRKVVIFSSDDDELNKKILEKENIDILLLNLSSRKDRMKQRDSGFNHVLARLAKKKNISLGINLDEIINSKSKEKSEILARVRQNIKLCNKNKLKMKFISSKKRDRYNLKSLGLLLGMPTWMTRDL
jgi:ribonuclease P/MRP protein subunit RPP1